MNREDFLSQIKENQERDKQERTALELRRVEANKRMALTCEASISAISTVVSSKDDATEESIGKVERNVEHLKIVINQSKEFIEDLKAVESAITLGEEYLANNTAK